MQSAGGSAHGSAAEHDCLSVGAVGLDHRAGCEVWVQHGLCGKRLLKMILCDQSVAPCVAAVRSSLVGVRLRKVVRWWLARWVNSVDRDVVAQVIVRTGRRRSDGARPRRTLGLANLEVSAGEAHINLVLEAITFECCLEANVAAAAAAAAAVIAAAVESMGTRPWRWMVLLAVWLYPSVRAHGDCAGGEVARECARGRVCGGQAVHEVRGNRWQK